MSTTFKKELDYLREKQFLNNTENKINVIENIHSLNIWAEIFWRRRFLHERREDPEVNLLSEFDHDNILEIGAAYGRVLKKVSLNEDIYQKNLHGVEICGGFQKYFELFQKNNPYLRDCIIYFDNFFDSSNLKLNYYDIIYLPMNTFPSFNPIKYDELFSTVRKYLKSNGVFVFSTYKIDKTTQFLKISKEDHNGEFLVELGLSPITGEHFRFEGQLTDYGAKVTTYSLYSILNREYVLQNQWLYRGGIHFVESTVFEELFQKHNFTIDKIDKTSHSIVYCLRNQD
ncbi:MAG: hypothetical protein OEZ01_10910 [Candidatus Heimdallarchaeota archaeon]|nr:hypothetical protein [Candidatus Heimdallarchaeota archaeon]MDH5646511.1 hypothetical protein [Candidatus Heimdallarchaeota archaeon]